MADKESGTADHQSLTLQSTFANLVYVVARTDYVRVAFGETVLGEQDYHTAVTMPTADAVELANLILSLVKKISGTNTAAATQPKQGDQAQAE